MRIKLSGPIDQGFDRRSVLATAGDATPLVFDLSEVHRIKSFGIREWLSLVASLPQDEFFFVRMRPSMVAQLNMVSHFAGRGVVVSVYLPYACAACGREEEVLFDLRRDLDRIKDLPPPIDCPSCKAAMSFDEVPEQFLAFARNMSPPAPSADAAAVIDGEAGERAPEPAGGEMIGKYRIIERIAYGGTAEILHGRAPDGSDAAIKRLLSHLARKRTYAQQFEHEAKLAASLAHPNVVRVVEIGHIGKNGYIVMEYVRGFSLDRILETLRARSERTPIAVACFIAREAALGIFAAHRALGAIHGDVSPDNILVSRAGEVKVIDFGSSTAVARFEGGKTPYLSPEQVTTLEGQEDQPLDPRSDVFALGTVLWELITGGSLFKKDRDVLTLRAILEAPIPPLDALRDDAPRDLCRAVDRALNRRPSDRHLDTGALASDLTRVLRELEPIDNAVLAAWLSALIR
jgi:tRNA A-37 threonylcarbamoyl transferase component Bud32